MFSSYVFFKVSYSYSYFYYFSNPMNTILKQSGMDRVANKIRLLMLAIIAIFRELNVIIASQLSEQVIDEVYDALMRSYKILVGDASAIRIDSPPRRSRLSSSDSSRHGASDISITDSSHQSDHSPLVSNF